MSPARIVILAIALVAGLGAALLISRPPKITTPSVTTYEPAPTVEVLVAAADIPLGNRLAAGDLRWIAWPLASLPTGVIRRQDAPEGEAEFVGQVARAQLFGSEPIRREKLIRTDGSGFLSAILPAGKRAVAITTERSGANTAGGFILPNDRVDVIRTSRDDSNNKDGSPPDSEAILVNVRVLAIGQNVQEKNGEKVVVGETATLELDPQQVDIVTLAQKTSSLSLALRSLQDAGDLAPPASEGGMTLVRYGVTSKGVKP
jgi:pilus assembly protein CpaB